jgi:hypothetical protein
MQRLQDTQEPAHRFAGELQGGEVHLKIIFLLKNLQKYADKLMS